MLAEKEGIDQKRQQLYWEAENSLTTQYPCIVVRDNGSRWNYDCSGIGDYKGVIVAQIPYCSNEAREWAIAIAEQICEKVSTRF